MDVENCYGYKELKKEIEFIRLKQEDEFNILNEKLKDEQEINEKRYDHFMSAIKILKSELETKASRAMVTSVFALMASVFSASFYLLWDEIKDFGEEIKEVRKETTTISLEISEIKGEIKSLHALDNFLKDSQILIDD